MKPIFRCFGCLLLTCAASLAADINSNSRYQLLSLDHGGQVQVFKLDTWTGRTWIFAPNSHTYGASTNVITVSTFRELLDQDWNSQRQEAESLSRDQKARQLERIIRDPLSVGPDS